MDKSNFTSCAKLIRKNFAAHYKQNIVKMEREARLSGHHNKLLNLSLNNLINLRKNKFTDKKINDLIEQIKKNDKIDKIEILDRGLKITTKQIKIKNRYNGGIYNIYIRLSDYRIKIFNTSKGYYGRHDGYSREHSYPYNHPHVHYDGYPCFGNITNSINSAFQQLKFDIAVNLIIKFLESYTNNDDGAPYIYISMWKSTKYCQEPNSKECLDYRHNIIRSFLSNTI